MDVGIVGGGIIGLACARALLTARPTLRLVVWEREAKLASQQSARSSNVLHAGIYYKPGSERAQLCVAGAEMARRYVIEHDLPARLDAGKLILAVEREELPGLHALMQRGQENGVKDLQLWDEAFLRRKGVKRGVAGIWSPHTGIVDWEQFSLQLARDVVRLGGEIRLSANPTEYLVSGAAKFVLNCAGLQADRVAMTLGGKAEPSMLCERESFVL
jgi:L-2-hydroxyglutarate oxidase LhgO